MAVSDAIVTERHGESDNTEKHCVFHIICNPRALQKASRRPLGDVLEALRTIGEASGTALEDLPGNVYTDWAALNPPGGSGSRMEGLPIRGS